MKPILEAGEETVVRSDVCKTSRNNAPINDTPHPPPPPPTPHLVPGDHMGEKVGG